MGGATIGKDAAILLLRELQQERDTELAHSEADDVLCALLSTLGHDDVVKEFRAIERWCA